MNTGNYLQSFGLYISIPGSLFFAFNTHSHLSFFMSILHPFDLAGNKYFRIIIGGIECLKYSHVFVCFCFGNILQIFWKYFGEYFANVLQIFWKYFAIYCRYSGNNLQICWKYFSELSEEEQLVSTLASKLQNPAFVGNWVIFF